MKVTGKVEVEINERELSSALWQKIFEMLGKDFDDAGCDWYTDTEGNTYVAEVEWKVSSNPIIASLVDSANYSRYGKVNKFDNI
ncbi:hypothetical protein WGM54_18620 [Paenibacillus polymyxa]|uniref:hypothetical protein n=1 Tax=Paenibacillus polymyxa TaxID=1406 RepID=UPI00307DF002